MLLLAIFKASKELLHLWVCRDCSLCISSSSVLCIGAWWSGSWSRRCYVFRVPNQAARSALSGAPAVNMRKNFRHQQIRHPKTKPYQINLNFKSTKTRANSCKKLKDTALKNGRKLHKGKHKGHLHLIHGI